MSGGVNDVPSDLVTIYDDSDTARLLRNVASGKEGPRQGAGRGRFGAVLNVCNTILGSGVLAMASGFHSSGIITVFVLLPLVGAASFLSLQWIVRSIEASGERSKYTAIGGKAFGRRGVVAVAIIILVQQLGASIAYLIIVANVIHPFVAHLSPPAVASFWFWKVIVACAVFPLCSSFPSPFPFSPFSPRFPKVLKDISSLAVASGFSVLFLLAFVVLVVVDSVAHLASHGLPEPVNLFSANVEVFAAFPLAVFAFVCQQNVPPVYGELKQELQTPAKFRLVSATSITLCGTVYALAGLFGYLRWYAAPGEFPPDLLSVYHNSTSSPGLNVFIEVIVVAVAASFALSFPIMVYELRHSLQTLLFGHRPFSWLRQLVLNVCIIVPVTVIAIYVPNIVDVFSVIGASTGACLVFLLPPLIYSRLTHGHALSRRNPMGLIIVFAGGALALVAFVVACMDLAEKIRAGHL